jgi:flagella basal body P-ring formation protein FlgA
MTTLAVLVLMNLAGSITAADVGRLLDSQLPHTLGADSLHWSLANPWAPMGVPAGATDLRVSAPPGEPRPGVEPLVIQILRDGEVLRAQNIAVRCDRVGAAVRLRRARPLGSLLAAEDLETVTAALPPGPRPLFDAVDATGLRLRRSLPAGAWLSDACVERVPAVRRGAGLEVRAETGALVVRFQAVAQQEGRPGDVIAARGPRPKGLIHVRVLGPGLAELVP